MEVVDGNLRMVKPTLKGRVLVHLTLKPPPEPVAAPSDTPQVLAIAEKADTIAGLFAIE